ncbi:tetratricopeptide repeat protein [Pelagimonas sp. KU-00592-HH]|uniref:tetratricopeptide repeat protein n=1 Tax=Pelagimonas sp. KU-00592-HH TaxID=3127651 RepID=UPI00310A441B
MPSRNLVLISALAIAPFTAWAAGGNDFGVPKPSETTKDCKSGEVWDKDKKRCVKAQNSSLSDDILYGAVREYAYAGQFDTAQTILSVMSDQSDDRVLTYWGFTHRRLGDPELGMAFYEKALAQNPDNLLARSYKGQAHVESGDLYLAWLELDEIRARGGEGTWPAVSLENAIRTGSTYNH